MTSTSLSRDGRVRIVVATTVLLSFISFWRAAAIVLSDLGSTAFYVGGIVEQAVGKAAPWFILGVMCFSYAVRAVYIESSAMFVRGGVYRVVKEAMGGTLAKLSVSALLFDYVLTGPISGVSAGQYLVGLLNDLLHRAGSAHTLPVGATAAFVAILITAYFWWRNTQGIHESSEDALRIMKVTTVMVVLMVGWCGLGSSEFGGEDTGFVVQRLKAGGAQDGLAEPLQPEDQQQPAYDHAQRTQRDQGHCRSEYRHDHR